MIWLREEVRSVKGVRLTPFTKIIINDPFMDRAFVAASQYNMPSDYVRVILNGKEDVVAMRNVLIPTEHVEAYGVKGAKSRAWRKVFTTYTELCAWVDRNKAEIHGCIDFEVIL